MYARQNDYGTSVNESAVCEDCLEDTDALEASWLNWTDAEDVTGADADDTLYPIDNPDALCNGCGCAV